MRIALVLCLALAGEVAAEPAFGTFDELRRALPTGWQLDATKGELAIARVQKVRVAGRHLANAHYSNVPVVARDPAPEIRLQLVYKLEPQWTAKRIADATAANATVDKSLVALRAKHAIDDIKTSKGRPLPSTPDEEKRLADYHAEYAKVAALKVALPRCTIGGMSVFDGDNTHTLQLMVDPPIAMREAYAIVELLKRRCR